MSTFNITTLLLSVLLVAFVAGCTSEEVSSTVSPSAGSPSAGSSSAGSSSAGSQQSVETSPETEAVQDEHPDEASVSVADTPGDQLSDSISPVANFNVTPTEALFAGPDLFVNSMRHWSDASGTYSTKAELLEVKMKERRVRLLKENGVVVLVNYESLSVHDKNFVMQFIEYHRQQDVSSAPKLVDTLD